MTDVALPLWFKDQAVIALLIAAFGWLILGWILYWVLLHILDKQRWAEIPRTLLRPLFIFLVLCLLLGVSTHLIRWVEEVTGSGPVQNFSATLLRSMLRIAIGFSLWFCITSF